ncbi:helix-turn-helix transcriptional regulator [Clostridium lundense]|uniref:helix-turn-helix transcriptional regulator n=1 Tax=Clostridium lundense TaxID=319475 RepID=UPI00047F234E|nr:helix-turn-helix domain-containing protein [Clostridium lundense]
MDKKQFIEKIDEKLKLIRNEKDFTQDRMAEIIGISKKTLVQIEKGRSSLGWTGAVTVSTIFKDSEILQMTFGGDTEDIILSIAFNNYEDNYKNTLGGKVWWRKIKSKGIYTIQQNIITNHYRILDDKDRRISSSFDINYIEKRLEELYEQGGK